MAPLALCSILALAAVVDRLIYYARAGIDFKKFRLRLREAGESLFSSDLPEWVTSKTRSPVAQLVVVYHRYAKQPAFARERAVENKGRSLLSLLERRMRLLSSIAQVAPLLGLLGTVAGLVSAFYVIELKGGTVQPIDLAGGIWEALLTTVVGLCVGIPSLLAHHYFEARGDGVRSDMDDVVGLLDELLFETNGGDESRVSRPEAANT